MLVYPGASNLVYKATIKADPFKLFGLIVKRDSIFQDRAFTLSNSSLAPTPLANVPAALTTTSEFVTRIAPQADREKHLFFLRLSLLSNFGTARDMLLLLLCNLLHSDYCIIKNVGPVSALDIFNKFLRQYSSNLDFLGRDIFPSSWSGAAADNACDSLRAGILAFLFHPVLHLSPDRTSARIMAYLDSYNLAHPESQLICPPSLASFLETKCVWLRDLLSGLWSDQPFPLSELQPFATYSHFGDSAASSRCLTIDAIEEALKRRPCQYAPKNLGPWTSANLPALPTSVIAAYIQKRLGTTDSLVVEDYMAAGLLRLDHTRSFANLTLAEVAEDSLLRLIKGDVPASLDKGDKTVCIAVKCVLDASSLRPFQVVSIEDASCTCTIRAMQLCNHICALLMLVFVNMRSSAIITSLPCTWHPDDIRSKSDTGPLTVAQCIVRHMKLAELGDDPAEVVKKKLDTVAAKKAAKDADLQKRLSHLTSGKISFAQLGEFLEETDTLLEDHAKRMKKDKEERSAMFKSKRASRQGQA